MSIRCSGFASRSFIIGSRLWPPAMMRASGPSLCSDGDRALDAGRALVLEWRGGLQRDAPFAQERLGSRLRGAPMSSRCSYCTGASVPMTGDRGSFSGPRLADLGVEQARGEAAALDVPQRGPVRARRGDRRLAAEPRERERALGVDLADARRGDRRALGEVPEAGRRGAGVEAVDEADGVGQAGLLDEQALEQVDARVELLVDRRHDVVDGRALLHDPADTGR